MNYVIHLTFRILYRMNLLAHVEAVAQNTRNRFLPLRLTRFPMLPVLEVVRESKTHS